MGGSRIVYSRYGRRGKGYGIYNRFSSTSRLNLQRRFTRRPNQGSAFSNLARSFLVGAGKGILVGALIGGLTAMHPLLGAVASHAYSSYGYGSVGIGLFTIYRKWKSGQETGREAMTDATGVGSGVAVGGAADRTAVRMVSELKMSGTIDEIGKQTGLNTKIYSEMLQGSISAGESQGFSELAKYAVGRAVGP